MKFRLIETQLKEVANINTKSKGEEVEKKFFDNFISEQSKEDTKFNDIVLRNFENSESPFGSTIFDEEEPENEQLEKDIFDVTDMLENLGQLFEKVPEEPDTEMEETLESYNLTKDEVKLIMNDNKKMKLAKNLIILEKKIDFNDPTYKDFNPDGDLITIGNEKLGNNIMIFNMTTAAHCPSLLNGMCQVLQNNDESKIACYAYQDESRRPGAFMLRIRQMKFWQTASLEEILAEFKRFVDSQTSKPKELRFNQSGDIDTVEDIQKMAAVGKMLQDEYGILTYTYTARSDLKEHFKMLKNPEGKDYVVIQGSGFYSSDRPEMVTPKDFTPASEKLYGKTFKAFPSKHELKPEQVKPNVTYLEDLNEDRYKKSNPNGWFLCVADCSRCHVCKDNRVHNIAVGIHRSYMKRKPELEGDPVAAYASRERMRSLYALYSSIEDNMEGMDADKFEKLRTEFEKDKTFNNKFRFDDIMNIIDKKIKNIENHYMKRKDVRTDTEKMSRYATDVKRLEKNKERLQSIK